MIRILLIFLLLSQVANADVGFFNDKARGWHWYEQNSITQDKEAKKDNKTQNMTPTEKIDHLRKDVEKKLHAAIVDPSEKNLIAYIKAQRIVMNQSEKFSDNWKKTIYKNPYLDETLNFPVNNTARHLYVKIETEKKTKVLQDLSKEYGLFYFFKGGCRYCHAFAPHVKRFAKKYDWNIVPISMDGGVLTEFPNAKHNNGVAENLGISHVPALIAVNPKTQAIIPLAYGMVSESEIEERAIKLREENQ